MASGFITCLPIEHSDPIGIAMGIVLVVLHIIRWRASEKKDTPQIA